jgi:hypothetical protein
MISETEDRFKPDPVLINQLYSKVDELNSESMMRKNKLESKIPHDEWLLYMRSVWGFKDTESNAKTGLHPAQFSAVLKSISIME